MDKKGLDEMMTNLMGMGGLEKAEEDAGILNPGEHTEQMEAMLEQLKDSGINKWFEPHNGDPTHPMHPEHPINKAMNNPGMKDMMDKMSTMMGPLMDKIRPGEDDKHPFHKDDPNNLMNPENLKAMMDMTKEHNKLIANT